MDPTSGKGDPGVLRVTADDVVDALGKGLRDFQALPFYGLCFGALYAAGGIIIVLSTAFSMSYIAYSLAAGFALIGPFVATGFCEVSRLREARQQPSFNAIWSAIKSRKEIGSMACVTMFIFILWIYQLHLLMELFFGREMSFASLQHFVATVFTTNNGLIFLALGNLISAALSFILFLVTVISFPLLLDRDDIDCMMAMITSVRAVAANPGPMIAWAALSVMLMIVSALPFFLSLMVTLPVLGHATWHLYRRAVARPMMAVN